MTDPFDLKRFVQAQDPVYRDVQGELARGRKQTHWMWFVFPQVAGLGRSAMAQRYAIADLDEAVAYVGHPVLGPRLRACARTLTRLDTHDPVAVLGPVDAQKLQSSMTLFARAAPYEPVFAEVLDQYFDGVLDEGTLARL
jgi:uncharacterized protein (DUF1810 family)